MERLDTICKAVSNLNDEIYSKLDFEDRNKITSDLLRVDSNGKRETVYLMNIVLWDSEYDLRHFDLEGLKYEPIYEFLKSKLMDVLSIICKIKL